MPYLHSTYDLRLVCLSYVVAAVASYTALNLAGRVLANRGRTARLWLVGGAAAMGGGIWSMHFLGMLAFHLPIPITYDVPLTVTSLLIAMVVSGFALHRVSRASLSTADLAIGGLLMGGGICAMHYSGMAALRMFPAIDYDTGALLASVAIAVAASVAALKITFTLREARASSGVAKKIASALVMALAVCGMHYTGMYAARFVAGSICLAGGQADNTWLAVTVSLATFCIMGAALLLSVIDARMDAQTALLVDKLSLANEKLHYQALHDTLTGLPNRTLLEDRIEQAILRASRKRATFAVLFLDLDRFKTVNDSLGHHYGDRLLQQVAARLRATMGDADTLARLGGDEFVLATADLAHPRDASAVAQRLIDALALPLDIDGQEQRITCSIGIALYPDDGETLQALMVNADGAMYHAKKSGRNNYQFFAREMNAAAHARLELQNNLRRAVERQEFELHYQPKVDVGSGRVTAIEALVRWRDPDKGLVPPGEFIPLAEEIGLIGRIGEWVLREACRQNRAWQDEGLPPLRVAVNLSAAQFRQADLPQTIDRILRETGLPPAHLELEVTESVVMHDAAAAVRILDEIHGRGIHISIDDFGTGYSSLSYLKRLPIDQLKIDRSFVSDLSRDADDASIVRTVIALAHSLRLKVVAEGVETAEQLEFLEAFDCDEYQGYYRSRPLPAAEFAELLRRSSTASPETAGT